jgi:hypothetical protein
MADLPPPYLAAMAGGQPDKGLGDAYVKAQMQQMIAQMLLQNGQQGNRPPENWNSMKLVPRLSPLSSLGGIASTLLGAKEYRKGLQSQNDYFGRFYGGMNGNDQPQQPATIPMQTSTPLNPDNPMVGENGVLKPGATMESVSNPGPVQQVPNPQAQQQPITRLPGYGNLNPQMAQAWLMSGNPGLVEKAKLYMEQLNKYNFPTGTGGERPGMPRYNQLGKIIGYAPDVAHGIGYRMGDNGEPEAYQLPGAAQMMAQNESEVAGAKKGAEVASSFNVLPGVGGGSQVVGGPGSPLARSYFASPGGATPAAPNASVPNTPAAPNAPPAAPTGMWSTVPKLTIPQGIGTNPIVAGHIENAKEIARGLSTDFGNEADTATQKMNNNNEALNALPNAEVGPLTHWLTDNRAKLAELGLPVPKSGSITPTYVLNKNLLNSALQGAKQIYGARMTSNEVMLQKNEAAPSTATTAAAIKSLIMQDNAKNAYFVKRANDFSKYVSMGGDPTQFKAWYAKSRPLIQFAREYAADPRALAMLKEHPEQLPAFKAKYGFTPSDD